MENRTAPTEITDPTNFLTQFKTVRSRTEAVCQPLEIEDHVIQSMEDVSPPKWHLGHTTWFFEQVVLNQFIDDYQPLDPKLYFLFNSYYKGFGAHLERSRRGFLSRPSTASIYEYRREIDLRVEQLVAELSGDQLAEALSLIELGLNHEQQHQELLVTDIKHILFSNPLKPSYRPTDCSDSTVSPVALEFIPVAGGLVEIGAGPTGFAYDNERPRHKVYLNDFAIANRLVTNGDYLAFMNDDGYQNADLWLSDAWALLAETGWQQPLYWSKNEKSNSGWQQFTLGGLVDLNLNQPVAHVSYYEAAAFARWSGKRLPTEAEWERAVSTVKLNRQTNFVEAEKLKPTVAAASNRSTEPELFQMAGDLWEWTGSAYLPYPGYVQVRGVLGEYNGKFMSSQMVLRGGSCATPASHYRTTYRNFFQPEKRWQFSGIRLACDR